MKKVTLILLLVIFMTEINFAQSSKVTRGALYTQQGKFENAIIELEEALSKPELITKGKTIAKAHYYLSLSYLNVGIDTTTQSLYKDPLLKSKFHLDKAIYHPEGSIYKKRAQDPNYDYTQEILWGALYNYAITLFNDRNDALALEYFVAADQLKNNHFLTKRMLGANYLVVKDSTQAITSFKSAIKIFNKKYGDFLNGKTGLIDEEDYKISIGQMNYITQQLAILYQAEGRTREAIATINSGLELFPEDKDIKLRELDIYRQSPDLFEDARVKFTNAILDYPEDENIKLAYADLLNKNNEEDAALVMYDLVYKANPQNVMANYGKGAYFINKAAKISEAKMKLGSSTEDEAKIEKMDDEITELIKNAYPFIKWLHEYDKHESEWLIQLVNITSIIGSEEEMLEYSKKLKSLNQRQ